MEAVAPAISFVMFLTETIPEIPATTLQTIALQLQDQAAVLLPAVPVQVHPEEVMHLSEDFNIKNPFTFTSERVFKT